MDAIVGGSEGMRANRSAEGARDPSPLRAERSIVLAGADFEPPNNRRRSANFLMVWTILLFWTASYSVITARQFSVSPSWVTIYFWPRLMTAAFGALLSIAMAIGQAAVANRKLAIRAAVALAFAVGCSTVAAAMTFLIERPFDPNMPPLWPNILPEFYSRIFTFGSISAIILAVSYAEDIRRREQRIVALQALADSAQVRALRNQLNPHFLFNALNSIAALIASGQNADAERMTEDVADFLRVSIAMDGQMLIPLEHELRLQDLYLHIQKVRFPDRLLVESDVPGDLRDVLVPALITQPLIENSMKYAVAHSTGLVRLSIRARRVQSGLEITIEDDGGNAACTAPKGATLGLSNVTERLRAHYGDSASFHAAAKDSGGFSNVILIPNA
jgi:two-component system LytT family sensor kinase